MIFGTVDIRNSDGCYLAHSLRLADGRVPKGTLITPAVLERLAGGGIERVVVARLEPGDLHEDEAASRVARALGGEHVSLSTARTGRVNLVADTDGLCHFEAETIREANAVSEGITVATLPENQWVTRGRLVATVKIIPYAVRAEDVDRVLGLLVGRRLRVLPPVSHRATLIQTRLASVKETVLDKTRRVIEERLAPRAVSLHEELRCDHRVEELLAALRSALARRPDWLLIVGASAISDRADVIPAAIVAAGGTIDRYGIPVDPGNLLLLAHHDETRIIGLPGCARSPRYNGLDMFVDRMACGVPITDLWLGGLSVGGLLAEPPDRPSPRLDATDPRRVGAIVLAAGSSRRAGPVNKLLVPMDGTPMIAHVAAVVRASRVERVVAITGFEHDRVADALAPTGVEIVHNAAHEVGMAGSVVAGVSHLADLDAVVVCLGDMPHVTAAIVDRLVEAYRRHPERSIFLPVKDGRRGNPVLFGKASFAKLMTLTGDTGARALVRDHPEAVCEVAMEDGGVLVDYDTAEALESLDTGTAVPRAGPRT